MLVVDGTYKDYLGIHYITFLYHKNTLGMTTQDITEFFRIHKKRVLQAIGSLHIKAELIVAQKAKPLRKSGKIPKTVKDPKFWTFKQVEAIVKATPNKFVNTGLRRLESFQRAPDEVDPKLIGTFERMNRLIEEREQYEDDEALKLLPLSYTSKCISKIYPAFCNLVRSYSEECKARTTWDYLKQSKYARNRHRNPNGPRILDLHSMYKMISYTLSEKFRIRTDVRAWLPANDGHSPSFNYVRLYPKDVIDKFMAEQGIEKLCSPEHEYVQKYIPLAFDVLPVPLMKTRYGRRIPQS